MCDIKKVQIRSFFDSENLQPKNLCDPEKVQRSRILPFTRAARALGVKSEETIKANSISIVEILQYENSNKLSWSTKFSRYKSN